MSNEDYVHALSTADRLKRYISALLNDRDNFIKHLEAENNDLKQMLEDYKDSIGTLEDENERLAALESAVREMLGAGD